MVFGDAVGRRPDSYLKQEARAQKPSAAGGRSQKSEIRGQRSEVRGKSVNKSTLFTKNNQLSTQKKRSIYLSPAQPRLPAVAGQARPAGCNA